VIRLGSALGHLPGGEFLTKDSEETNCDEIAFQIMDELKETLNEVINETQETWNEVVHETQETVNEVVHETQETLNGVVNETQETFHEVVQTICSLDEKRPDIVKSTVTDCDPSRDKNL
jgi:DNA anti-recombination protein RmuC